MWIQQVFMLQKFQYRVVIYLWYIIQMQSNTSSAGVQYEKEFVVCCLDLLSGLVEGLGSGIESLVIICYNEVF